MIGDGAPGGGPTGGGPTGGGPTGGGPTGRGPTGATAASGVPHAWQNEFPSGFCVPHRAHVSAIYLAFAFAFVVWATGSARGFRLRRTAPGTALSAMPQLGQKPEATMCMWQFGHTVSANPM
jgi:hypothetical protein